MVRQDITPFSPFVDMVMTGIYGGGANFQWRNDPHAPCGNDIDADNVTEPYWIRLTRTGDTFAGYLSPDGFNWTQLGGNHTTIMFDPVLIGFCVTSHEPGFLVTATFEAPFFPPPPPPPHPPSPYPGAVDVPVDANLSWPRGDNTIQDEVYFGTDPCMANLPKVATILSSVFPPLYDPPTDLIASTTYYWYIVETGGNMVQCIPVPDFPWYFTTVRGQAQPEYPFDGALFPGDTYPAPPSAPTHIYTPLDFTPGATAVSFTGYFSNDYAKVESRAQDAYLGQPPFSIMPHRFYVGLPPGIVPGDPYTDTLLRSTMYYWTVDSNDAFNNVFPGDIWEFGILDWYAFAPSPADGAINVDPNVLLSWKPGFGVTVHDIYMGTSSEDVNNAFYDALNPPHSSPELVATRVDPNYQCSNLLLYTEHFWRVDEVSNRYPPPIGDGIYYKGDVWSFKTTLLGLNYDFNNDGLINFIDYAILANDWNCTGTGFSGDINNDGTVDFRDLTIITDQWMQEQ
jgi:hypothetical protein